MPDEQLTVYYPSGLKLGVFGRFATHGQMCDTPDSPYGVAINVLESAMIGNQLMSPGSVALVDPRCVIAGESSGVIYTPRPYAHLFPAEFKRWMKAHPEWPDSLERQRRRG